MASKNIESIENKGILLANCFTSSAPSDPSKPPSNIGESEDPINVDTPASMSAKPCTSTISPPANINNNKICPASNEDNFVYENSSDGNEQPCDTSSNPVNPPPELLQSAYQMINM